MKISFVSSTYNDAFLLKNAISEIECFIRANHISGYELILVDDGSDLENKLILEETSKLNKKLKLITLRRNYGQFAALQCGLKNANYNYVVRFNIDMQDSFENLHEMISILENNKELDLVIGKYRLRNSSLFNKVQSNLYYLLLTFLTGYQFMRNTSPLRVFRKEYLDLYSLLNIDGLTFQTADQILGATQGYVEVEHRKRAEGKSSYNFHSRLKLALTEMLYFNGKALFSLFYLGMLLLASAFVAVCVLIYARITDQIIPGWFSITALIVFGFGINFMILGLFSLYLKHVFEASKNQPSFIEKYKYTKL